MRKFTFLTSVFFLSIVLLGLGTGENVFALKKIGDACTESNECESNTCDDSYCTCGDTVPSNHCAQAYGGTAADWKCVDEDEDPDSSRGEWNFCKKADYLSSLPKNSTADVKYPVERKILMGYACDDHDACLSQRGGYHVCDSTTIASTVENDPWFAQDKELKVCNLGTLVNVAPENTIQEVCTEQYGDGTWVKADGTGDLANLHVCQNTAKNNWMPTSLETMRTWAGPTTPGSSNNSVNTTFLGFDISTQAPELVTPETKIKIPGVFFTKITKESNITTDESGASWLNIPFLGEFISAIYKYSVGLISLIAVMVLIISGVQIITSAGNSEAISSAKHRIVSSVIAIVITAGSYTILYTVNPDLVNLKNLKILVVQQIPLVAVSELSPESYQAVTGQPLKLDDASRQKNVELAIVAAQKAGIDPCFAYVIVRHESAGNPSAVGHDEDYPLGNGVGARYDFLLSGITYSKKTFQPPSNLPKTPGEYFRMDKPARQLVNASPIRNDDGSKEHRKLADLGSPPDYGIDWRFSHGLGLGQVTFGGNAYCDKSKGIRGYRSLSGRCFTVPELLTPEGGVDAMVAKLQYYYPLAKKLVNYSGSDSDISANARQKYSPSNPKVSVVAWTFAMYGAGTGGGTLPRSSNDKRVEHFNECKDKGLQITVPKDSKPKYLESTAPEDAAGNTNPTTPTQTNSTPSSQQSQTVQKKVALIGSSTFFFGLNNDPPNVTEGFIQLLKKRYPSYTFDTYAATGQSSVYFKQQFDANVSNKGYNTLIIFGDLNGLPNGVATTQSNLSAIFQAAETQNIRVIAVGAQPFKGWTSWTTEWDQNIKTNNAWLANKPNGIDAFVNMYSPLDAADNDMATDPQYHGSDDLHFNQAGHTLLYGLIIQAGL